MSMRYINCFNSVVPKRLDSTIVFFLSTVFSKVETGFSPVTIDFWISVVVIFK